MIRSSSSDYSMNPDKPLLSCFLHELTIARKQLALYPPEHPHIKGSITKTLDILDDLFVSDKSITLGITPDALLYQDLWLDRDDAANKEFAHFFSSLGIASISFHFGLKDAELIRFNQLLRADRDTIESYGGFEQLLEQQQISHVSVIPIDYDAFQSNQHLTRQKQHLWESFLHGLQNGILAFDDDGSDFDLQTVADLLNQRAGSDNELSESDSRSFERFVESRIQQQGTSQTYTNTDRKFNSLLNQLHPKARDRVFASIFEVLEKHQSEAPGFLKKVPPQLLQGALSKAAQQKRRISSRILSLAQNLTEETSSLHQKTVGGQTGKLSSDIVKARLDVLFSEEKQDLYMPSNYQAALGQMLATDIDGGLPQEEKESLKSQLESAPAEDNFTDILLEMVNDSLTVDQEKAVQQNLLNLSRHYLDTGQFSRLLSIYRSWVDHLNSPSVSMSIFEEKLIAHHTQATFLAEVLDGFDLWDEDVHSDLINYIATVGEPYSDMIIERLGLAQTWDARKLWMNLLEQIGGDAQQKILEALNDERWYLIRNLLSVLNKNLAPSSLKVVQPFCRHEHPKVRMEATRILLTCNPATANRQLLKDLNNPDPDTLLAALEIAHLSLDSSVLGRLHQLISSDPDSESTLQTQLAAVRALAQIGNPESLPLLNRLIRKNSFINRRLKLLQEETIRSLTDFPGDAARRLLEEQSTGRFKQLARQAMENRS